MLSFVDPITMGDAGTRLRHLLIYVPMRQPVREMPQNL